MNPAVWRGAALCAIVAVATLAFTAEAPSPPPKISSWDQFEKELVKQVDLEKGPTYGLDRSPTFRQFMEHGDRSLWLEMLNQPDHPLVVLAGYLCVERKAPEKSFECALRAVARKPHGSSIAFLFPLMEALRRAEPSPANLKALTTVSFEFRPNDKDNEAVIVTSLSYAFLYKWFNDPVSDDSPRTFRSFALDRLYGDARKEKQTITERMKSALEAAAGVPGFPRLVFLTHTQRIDRDFTAAVFQTVADPAIDDAELFSMLFNHSAFVRDHAGELSALKVANSRKEMLDQANAQGNKLIEEARAAAARVQEQ